MLFNRKTSLVATLVLALVGTPTLARAAAPTHGSGVTPPVIAVAILPTRPRLRRRTRLASVRMIAWRILARSRQTPIAIEVHGQSLHSPLPLEDSYARGPPCGANPASTAGAGHAARL
jgi:hypothetical protein